MKIANNKLSQRIINATMAFCLVLSSVSASVPFIASEKVNAAVLASTVYDALPSTSPATNYPSQAFQATSTSEFGDNIHLGGSNRVLDKVIVTMSNWAKYEDYSSNPLYSDNSNTWSLPVTLNVYDNQFDVNGTPTHKIATVTQNQSIPWRPASDADCAPTSNGKGWKVDGVCYNYSGIAANAVFDLSSLHVTLPDDIVVSVAYNTQTHGYAPTGVAGPYDSLNVAVPVSQPVATGSDISTDTVLVNSTWSGAYGDGGTTGLFRKTSDWTPYGTVALKVTATPANTAPAVNFNSPTPAENSHVRGIVTPHVVASDDYGMSSYYIRLWKNSFESGIGNLVYNNCSSAPGGYLLGDSQNVTCGPIDTTKLSDGKYVLSAQFLDGDNVWGSQLRTFYVDNTRPSVTVSTENQNNPSSLTITATDTNGSGVDRVTGNIYKYDTVSGTYSLFKSNSSTSLNPLAVNLSTLTDGQYYVRYNAADKAGNISVTYTFNFTVDHTAPAVPMHQTPFNNAIQNVNNFYFQWDDVADAVSYEAQFSQSNSTDPSTGSLNSGVWAGDANHNQPAASEAHSVGANGTWYWQVRSVDAAGNKSAWSTPWKLTIDMVAPAVPTHASPEDGVVTTTAAQTSIDWTDVNDPSGVTYIYQSSTSSDKNSDGSFVTPAYTSTPLTASEIPTPGTPEGVYYWHVKAVDGAGNESAWSTQWTIIVDNTAPVLSLNTVYTNTETSRTITGTTDPFAEVTVTVHSTPQTKVTTADADGKWSVTFDGLEIGLHIVTVSSKDKAGNVAEAPTQNFEVTTVPVVPQSNSSGPTNQGQPLVAFNNATPSDSNQSSKAVTDNDGQVLAAQDVKKNVASTTGAIKKSDGTWGVVGIAWYWILVLLAVIAAAWWLIAAYRRRQNEA